MDKEKVITDIKQIREDLNQEDRSAEELLDAERRKVMRDKMDLRSTRRVLHHFMKEGSITAQDKLIDILDIIEKEYKKIEDI